jgi:hypothetical protein
VAEMVALFCTSGWGVGAASHPAREGPNVVPSPVGHELPVDGREWLVTLAFSGEYVGASRGVDLAAGREPRE